MTRCDQFAAEVGDPASQRANARGECANNGSSLRVDCEDLPVEIRCEKQAQIRRAGQASGEVGCHVKLTRECVGYRIPNQNVVSCLVQQVDLATKVCKSRKEPAGHVV